MNHGDVIVPDPARWGLRLVALLGALIIFSGAVGMAVREGQLPPTSRGDVMRIIFTDDLPEQIEPLVVLVERAPGQLDLASTPRPPSEPRSVVVTEGPTKAVTPGRRGSRGRGRRRRSRR